MGPIEPEEFDVNQYPPEYVTVDMDEAIHSILERVEEGWVRSPNVVLIIPRGAQAFHNTHDFLALGKLPGARQVCVSIASPDPTIAGLARVLGFVIVDVPEGHPALTQDPTLGLSYEDDIEKPTSPLPLGVGLGRWGTSNDWIVTEGQQGAPPPKRDSLTTSTWLSNPEDYEPISAGATPKDTSERENPKSQVQNPKSAVPPRTRPRQTSQLSSASLDSTSLGSTPAGERGDPALRIPRSSFHAPHVSPTPSGRIKARSIMVPDETRIVDRKLRYGGDLEKSFRWGRLVAILLLLVVASVVGSLYYAFTYLPEGTVAVTPLETSVTIPITFTISPGNVAGDTQVSLASHNLSLPLSPQSSTLSTDLTSTLVKAIITEEGTHPATGSRQVPRGKAQGTMRFTNQTTGPVSIPLGLKFKAANGVFVETTQGGTIRATDFNSGVLGTLELPIASTVDGPDGNIGAGQLAGVYAGKLSYINSAMQGGSLETQTLVTQDDITALETQLRAQVDAKVDSAIRAALPSDTDVVLITRTMPTTPLANVVPTYDHKAGDVADSVHISLSAEVHAYTYRESAVRAIVNAVVQDWVTSHYSGTVGPNLDKTSIQYTPLSEQTFDPATGKIAYTTSASGHVNFTLTNELARLIRDLVKGQDIQKAHSLINKTYGAYVNISSIQARVLWLTTDKLPTDAAHISVESTTRPALNPLGGSSPQTQSTSDERSSRP